jgi:hypothetical protein
MTQVMATVHKDNIQTPAVEPTFANVVDEMRPMLPELPQVHIVNGYGAVYGR